MAVFTVRISDEMHDLIKQAATQDKRSRNSEIEWLLAAALAMRQMADHAVGQVTDAEVEARLRRVIAKSEAQS